MRHGCRTRAVRLAVSVQDRYRVDQRHRNGDGHSPNASTLSDTRRASVRRRRAGLSPSARLPELLDRERLDLRAPRRAAEAVDHAGWPVDTTRRASVGAAPGRRTRYATSLRMERGRADGLTTRRASVWSGAGPTGSPLRLDIKIMISYSMPNHVFWHRRSTAASASCTCEKADTWWQASRCWPQAHSPRKAARATRHPTCNEQPPSDSHHKAGAERRRASAALRAL